MAYLTESALSALEKERPRGLSRVEVLALFAEVGDKFSASLLSTYVAWGLIPLSKRTDEGFSNYPVSSVRILNRLRQKVIAKVSYRDLREQLFGTEVFAREAVYGCLAELNRLAMRIEQKTEKASMHAANRERIERIRREAEPLLAQGDAIADL